MKLECYIEEENINVANLSLNQNHNFNKILTTEKILDSNHIKGNIITTTFPGLCLIKYSFNTLTTIHEQLKVHNDYIQISLVISGDLTVIKQNHIVKIKTKTLQIAFLSENTARIQIKKTKEPVCYNRLFISKQFINNIIYDMQSSLKDSYLNNIFENIHFHFGNIVISSEYQLSKIFEEITDIEYEHPLDLFFLKNKIKELLIKVHHLHKLNQKQLQELKWTDVEIQKLNSAKLYLENNFKNNITIKELSRFVYLNEFKLKKGFKELFNTTTHKYITRIRMNHALDLLEKKKTISEIATELGYKSSSHFIMIFKKIFGHTPKNK